MDNILEAMKIVSSLNETSLANSSRRPCLIRDLYVFRLKISNLSESADVPPPIDCDEEDRDDTAELGTDAGLLRFGNSFYAFLTPFILIIGLIGNSMSLKVFTSRVMRRLSSSTYLMALSVSDMLVLLTYVLLDWLNDGLKYWPGGYRLPLKNYNGACQAFMYASYMFRFMSAWFIVIFAVERYLAVCWPVHRKRLCTKRMAKRLILIVFFTAAVLCLYKPMLSQVYTKGTAQICTRNEHLNKLIFWLDTIYAFFITAVPSLAIIILNLPILKRLIDCKKVVVREKKIRIEFTITLVAISFGFICLNTPYFIIWCLQFQNYNRGKTTSLDDPIQTERLSGPLHIARTIFYVNYSMNFLLYCMGAYYRREISSLFRYYFKSKCSRYWHRTTPSKRRQPYKQELKVVRKGARLKNIDISYVHNGTDPQPENTTCPCVPV